MKKFIIILIALIIISAVIFIITIKPKNKCICEYCDPEVCNCDGECELNYDGTCNCEGCPCHEGTPKMVYVESRENSIIKSKTNIIVKRPELVNLKNQNLQQNINDLIIASVKPYQDEISDISEGFTADDSDDMIKNKSYKYIVDYNYWVMDNKYLSVVVNNNLQTGNSITNSDKYDGLRSSVWKETYVIDIDDAYSNDTLKVADVCDISNALGVMADEVKKQADQRGIDIILGSGFKEVPRNQRFYINSDKEKLFLYFEPGTIAKYSAGELLFEMPFSYNKSTHKFTY